MKAQEKEAQGDALNRTKLRRCAQKPAASPPSPKSEIGEKGKFDLALMQCVPSVLRSPREKADVNQHVATCRNGEVRPDALLQHHLENLPKIETEEKNCERGAEAHRAHKPSDCTEGKKVAGNEDNDDERNEREKRLIVNRYGITVLLQPPLAVNQVN